MGSKCNHVDLCKKGAEGDLTQRGEGYVTREAESVVMPPGDKAKKSRSPGLLHQLFGATFAVICDLVQQPHGTVGQRETNASASLAGAVPPRQAPWRLRARKRCAGHAGAGHRSQDRPCQPPPPWRTPLIQNLILHHLCRREETATYSELRELLVVLKC